MDEAKKNYRLNISGTPFPNMYSVFYVSSLDSYYKLPKDPNIGGTELKIIKKKKIIYSNN